MKYKDQAYTMAEMYAGKGCGICHNSGGLAFDLSKSDSCKRCHENTHDVVDSGAISSDSCVLCHSAIVTEYQTKNTPSPANASGTSHGTDFRSARSSPNTNYPCSECHFHEAVFGKSSAMGVPPTRSHGITCQTCHWPSSSDGGKDFPYRLRKDPDDLCVTCHHMRYTYGYNPISTLTAGLTNSWTLLPSADEGFPKLLAATPIVTASITAPCATPIEIRYWALDTKTFLSKGAASAAYALTNLVSRGLLGGSAASPSGGGYPHDSTQYDVMMGPKGGTFVQFSKDLNGTTLTYEDSLTQNTDNACVTCHMERDTSKGTYGHTFHGSEEGAKKVYGAGFDMAAAEADIEGLMTTLGDQLDIDNDGTAKFTRSGEDADLKAMTTKGLATATKVIMLGVAWNYNMLHGDGSEGIHNYKYVKSILTHCINIMTQLKNAALSGDAAKITWY